MESLTFSGVSVEYFGVFQVNIINLRSFHFGVTMEFSPFSTVRAPTRACAGGWPPAPPGIVMLDRVGVARAAHTRGQPAVAVHLDPRLHRQSARTRTILGCLDHAPLLDDLEAVDREDRLCPRLYLDRPAISTQADRVP